MHSYCFLCSFPISTFILEAHTRIEQGKFEHGQMSSTSTIFLFFRITSNGFPLMLPTIPCMIHHKSLITPNAYPHTFDKHFLCLCEQSFFFSILALCKVLIKTQVIHTHAPRATHDFLFLEHAVWFLKDPFSQTHDLPSKVSCNYIFMQTRH